MSCSGHDHAFRFLVCTLKLKKFGKGKHGFMVCTLKLRKFGNGKHGISGMYLVEEIWKGVNMGFLGPFEVEQKCQMH